MSFEDRVFEPESIHEEIKIAMPIHKKIRHKIKSIIGIILEKED